MVNKTNIECNDSFQEIIYPVAQIPNNTLYILIGLCIVIYPTHICVFDKEYPLDQAMLL